MIELTQLALARIDRACDVTDIIDNVTGAAVGVLVGHRAAARRAPVADGPMSLVPARLPDRLPGR